ncbi:TetR/AcrR family transcriptional regulator [Flavobacterium sp. RSP49]|uniref:TetR/AcrR family transcriptional regulator n=1 Tax=Flavobacterium bomense TaxID=2497483 RepID=A0A3S0ME28_9FLAO|nr:MULTISPECIES: TetR family transcriptional regulator C-terminal domain-containing protein [Flavobacterium]RTY82143.1 TetR/AcrR family transcriptional regulator [Flavobacterium sp. ZB4P23]RTY91593.1 TetR/AcrR family transcriptional regulator [Flavobacterium sp. RSP46]RTY98213.1 TetR/AcrR family transcriptional regulator [Flavobacterium sp. RSP49]RTZ05995.1 TetR/AcrR family transcriptional regulator [Flavobacterium bomense]RTZ07453.1 TetR/AcrR family transcriptional regulator [Flavobacterium s
MATKKTTVTKDKIVSFYMNYVLEHSEKPKSVYHFTKINDFTETEFYAFFGTIESIEKEIFKMFVEKTTDLLNKNKEYEMYDMKSKMLSFYFTFFEILTANRSYVVLVLKEHNNQLKKLMQLSGLRNSFRNYLSEIISDEFRTQQEKLQNFQEKSFQEASWIQLLLTLKFWLDDASAAFEKTDIYIEKSVKVTFELMNIAPIDSLIDFGKFIFKEKIYNK